MEMREELIHFSLTALCSQIIPKWHAIDDGNALSSPCGPHPNVVIAIQSVQKDGIVDGAEHQRSGILTVRR